jgi:hypothetical protein
MSIDHQKYATIKTGDILLFGGWNCAAMILRVSTQSEYTHAGIAIWLQTDNGRRLHCFEAGPCALQDVLSNGTPKRGCRLADIDLIMNYYTKVAVRKINVTRDNEFYAKLREFMIRYHPKSFRSMLKLAVLNAGLVGPPHDDQGSIYCSELCSNWLATIGALKEPILRDLPHHRTYPAAFSHNFVYPQDAFVGQTQLVTDDNVDDSAKGLVTAALILGLYLYIASTAYNKD